MLIALLVPLALASLLFTIVLFRAALSKSARPNAEGLLLGAVTNFFDTLGIGSFAPTMAWFKFRKLVPDRLIPPTMLVGHSLAVHPAGLHLPDPAWRCSSTRCCSSAARSR